MKIHTDAEWTEEFDRVSAARQHKLTTARNDYERTHGGRQGTHSLMPQGDALAYLLEQKDALIE